MRAVLISLLLACTLLAQAQQHHFAGSTVKSPFFRPDTTYNRGKVALVSGSILGIYGGVLVGLNQYWYKDYPRSRFHFFNDSREWMAIDKGGHAWSSYFTSRWTLGMYRWTGLKDRKAIWLGGMGGTFLQTSFEILDGFSAKWGFSWSDMAANFSGSMLVISQELAWHEQRIVLKVSSLKPTYSADVQDRANYLFGKKGGLEGALKDYNGTIIWASLNIHSFMKKDRGFAPWLNVAIGYGANGMFGGYANRWCTDPQDADYCDCAPANQVDRSDIRRYTQIYLSLDIDFTKIPTRSPVLRAIFNVINIIKVPAPTLEFNPVDKIKFYPLYF